MASAVIYQPAQNLLKTCNYPGWGQSNCTLSVTLEAFPLTAMSTPAAVTKVQAANQPQAHAARIE